MALGPVEAGSATRNDDVDVLPFINEDICDAVDAMEFPTGYHLSNEDTSVSLEGMYWVTSCFSLLQRPDKWTEQ